MRIGIFISAPVAFVPPERLRTAVIRIVHPSDPPRPDPERPVSARAQPSRKATLGARAPGLHLPPSAETALARLFFYTPAFPAGRAGGGGGREPDGDAGAALFRIDARIARITLRSVMKATIFMGPPQFEQTSGSTS